MRLSTRGLIILPSTLYRDIKHGTALLLRLKRGTDLWILSPLAASRKNLSSVLSSGCSPLHKQRIWVFAKHLHSKVSYWCKHFHEKKHHSKIIFMINNSCVTQLILKVWFSRTATLTITWNTLLLAELHKISNKGRFFKNDWRIIVWLKTVHLFTYIHSSLCGRSLRSVFPAPQKLNS